MLTLRILISRVVTYKKIKKNSFLYMHYILFECVYFLLTNLDTTDILCFIPISAQINFEVIYVSYI